jgi:hypothetical protein
VSGELSSDRPFSVCGIDYAPRCSRRAQRSDAEDAVVARHLFIVSRAHPWLYTHLLERFQDDPNVGVILDRRVGDRRSAEAPPVQGNRRKNERRRTIPAEDDLGVRSHYIVEL